jgi:hypothetical protein
MKRLTLCFAALALMAWPLAAEAGAKKAAAAAQVQAPALPALQVDVVNPSGNNVGSPFMHFQATVTNADSAADCIDRYLLAPVVQPAPLLCNLVTYVEFWVDGQFVVQDNDEPYSIGGVYNGPCGHHFATARAFRNVNYDGGTPVLLDADVQGFRRTGC